MTLADANVLLDAAGADDTPSAVNPSLTRAQCVNIIHKAINAGPRALAADGINLDSLMEKRVLQVTRNQKRPRI